MITCGFLGSGKITLLLKILPRLKKQYPKIAILENEIGETGVDGDFLKSHDLEVRELYGGASAAPFRQICWRQ